MPTGYTASVQDGTVTDFREFAFKCLRGLGVTITMRDEPWNAEIPEQFEPSDHHLKELAKAKKNLTEFLSKTIQELQEQQKTEYENSVKAYQKTLETQELYRNRYQTMLAKVEAWQVPETSEIQGAKKFMREQLQSSIDFDCGYSDYGNPQEELSFSDWIESKRKSLEWRVQYHEKEYANEIERTNARNAFLKEFRELIDASEEYWKSQE
ncbi:hypothetical protein [Caulobacter phage Cr30]|uniref:hypothetical protein n=1 Tax=Caulobacter phage Cr30 TaxID=1357714 RepID=UPI0004A9BAB5|nr:hypothetical protein OZ74_gp285 [Caulobacter phage Cr30]AGS81058.1 hypothetical protein [Caulobacter phage Cr30]